MTKPVEIDPFKELEKLVEQINKKFEIPTLLRVDKGLQGKHTQDLTKPYYVILYIKTAHKTFDTPKIFSSAGNCMEYLKETYPAYIQELPNLYEDIEAEREALRKEVAKLTKENHLLEKCVLKFQKYKAEIELEKSSWFPKTFIHDANCQHTNVDKEHWNKILSDRSPVRDSLMDGFVYEITRRHLREIRANSFDKGMYYFKDKFFKFLQEKTNLKDLTELKKQWKTWKQKNWDPQERQTLQNITVNNSEDPRTDFKVKVFITCLDNNSKEDNIKIEYMGWYTCNTRQWFLKQLPSNATLLNIKRGKGVETKMWFSDLRKIFPCVDKIVAQIKE